MSRSTSVTGSAKPARCNRRPSIAQVDERRDPRRHTALDFGFGGREGLPQFGQRVATEQSGKQQAIGLERAPHLDERAGQIVDELHASADTTRSSDPSANGRASSSAATANVASSVIAAAPRPASGFAAMMVPTLPLRASDPAHVARRRAEIERTVEPPQYRGEPLLESAATRSIRKVAGPMRHRARQPFAQQSAVEDDVMAWPSVMSRCPCRCHSMRV